MSKYLKRFNEELDEWEIISAPDISITQEISGTPIESANVHVTHFKYGDGTLDEALTSINDDITKLQRNVSWLAQHGGGGGGVGPGGASYGIEIQTPTIENGAAYVEGNIVNIEFMITGGTGQEPCQYAYQFGTSAQTDYFSAQTNVPIKLTFNISGYTSSSPAIIIRGISPNGVNLTSKSFRIYKSTLSMEFDKKTAGSDYENEVYNIMLNSTTAGIPLLVTNGLEGSKVTITVKYGDTQKQFTMDNVISGTVKKQISLWDIIEKKTAQTNIYYTFIFGAESAFGQHTAKSESFSLRVRIINPNAVTISLGVNGLNTEEAVNVPLDSPMYYNFKVFAPNGVNRVYYSAKIENNGVSTLILGQYYDEETHEEGAIWSSNPNAATESTLSSQYTIAAPNFHVGDTPKLYVKVWRLDGTAEEPVYRDIVITDAENDIFPRQYSNREASELYTMFASWNGSNASAVSKNVWTSFVDNYQYLNSELLETEGSNVTVKTTVYNGNDKSGIQSADNVPYMRLQNRAYAIADMSYYRKEINDMVQNKGTDGFTISISFMQDEYTDTKHTLFFWGENDSENNLLSGIRIDANKATWIISERTATESVIPHTLVGNITYGKRTTVDFSFVKENGKCFAKLYVNGTLNNAIDLNKISDTYVLPELAYFGVCKTQNTLFNYADVNIYEFNIYSRSLNDFQIVVNSKNARLLGSKTDKDVIDDYNTWKKKNFIYASEYDKKIPLSTFFSNGAFIETFDENQISTIAASGEIPVVTLRFDDNDFTEDYFYAKHVTTDTGSTYEAIMNYIDPSVLDTVNTRVEVSLQGTSTLTYRIKNLEVRMAEKITVKGDTYPVLFQPKKEWFPESQFTLKADVVDSAHANNAVLGEWINNNGGMNPNPAMQEFNANTRPKDVDNEGNPHTHMAAGTGEEIDYDEDVTIKHTLEGFPCLVFIKFANSGDGKYRFIGIYSFNLGRYSYYNMGMKFLKNFSRRNSLGNRVSCPKLIEYYEETKTLGTINSDNVYSFEFGDEGNGHVAERPVWTQYDMSVIKTYGDFKYPSTITDAIWVKLQNLFKRTAEFSIGNYYSDGAYTAYDNLYYWTLDTEGIWHRGASIKVSDVGYEELINAIDIHNSAQYFIIANAFGMTDSLGKNLTLRTWDGGNKWWPCFYDMDTALGLANDGSEDVPVTAALDKVELVINEETQTSKNKVTYHYDKSSYSGVLCKLWAIIRGSSFIYKSNGEYYYEKAWNTFRLLNGPLSTATKFSDIVSEKVNKCGELIYNYDYESKYVKDTEIQESESGQAKAAITFLHGTRVEYIKDWLTKHFYFLDGLFDAKYLEPGFVFGDNPYNNDILSIGVAYPSTVVNIGFVIQVTTPAFIAMSLAGDANYEKYYIAEANKDTVIYFPNKTSASSQLLIKSSSLISKFGGLENGFTKILDNNNPGILRSLTEFTPSNSSGIKNNPFQSGVFLRIDNFSSLERLDLSNTKSPDPISTYEVLVGDFNKLISIDISNSYVNAIDLPLTTLQYLNIKNSNIGTFSLRNQIFLPSVDFEGCNQLNSISIDNCSGLQNLTVRDKRNLNKISITNCSNIEEIIVDNCNFLTELSILNNPNLKKITVKNCTNNSLKITIIGCAPKAIDISGIESDGIITLPEREQLTGVTALTLSNCYNCPGIQYGASPIEKYGENNVFDLSSFTSLLATNLNIANMEKLKYVRVSNIEDSPFYLKRGLFTGCGNIERIFGHIGINESEVFNGVPKFHLNEPLAKIDGVTPFIEPAFVPTSEDKYYTNLTISTTNLANCFSNTSCSLSDAYYILQKCAGVTDISGLFQNCSNLESKWEDPLNKNMFEHCTGVTNISGLFFNCKIDSILDENLMSPFIGNITKFDNVFSGNYGLLYYARVFPDNNNIESVINYNPKGYDEWGETRFFDNDLLSTLTKVKEIKKSFNKCKINFGDDGCDLFRTTVKLESISDSFNDIDGRGDLDNIFGGNSEDDNEFSQVLSSVTSSFSFTNNENLTLPIGNNFLKKIKNSIVYICGYYAGRNDGSDYCFKNVKKIIKTSENRPGEDFPYDIFKDCVKLKEFPHLFEKIYSENELPINISLPGRIFSNCPTFENAAYCFSNLQNDISYHLEGGCFVDNKLKNIDGIFQDDMCKRNGEIPYRLFTEEETKYYDELTGLTHSQAQAYGITNDSGTLDTISDYTVLSGEYKSIRRTIEHGSSLFANGTSTGLTYYTANIDNWRDLVEDNEDYNPLEFILEGNNYYRNENYCPYRYKWNKFIFDNNDKFYEYVTPTSEKYTGIFEATYEGNPVVDPEKMPKEFEKGFVHKILPTQLDEQDLGFYLGNDNPIKTRFAETNYFCAPDIFRSFVLMPEINSVFANCGLGYVSEYGEVRGLLGVCPGFIFEPVQNIRNLSGVFAGFKGMLPNKWKEYVISGESEYWASGQTYSPELFSGLTNLYSINSLFKETNVWGRTEVPEALFKDCAGSLGDASSLWDGANFIDTNMLGSQLPYGLFMNCNNLNSISSMFLNRGPYHIYDNMFSYLYQPLLTDCVDFMRNASNVHGNVPELWNWPTSVLTNYTRAYAGIVTEQITNYAGNENKFIKFMRSQ